MNRLFSFAFGGLVLVLAARAGAADESAATAELPAALAGVAPAARILTRSESGAVRASFIPTSGVRLVVSGTGTYANNSQVAYQFGVGGQAVNVAFTPNGLVYATQGLAVIGTNPPVQGVVAGNTPVFRGLVGVQGSISNLQIVATPELFLIKTP